MRSIGAALVLATAYAREVRQQATLEKVRTYGRNTAHQEIDY